MQGVLGQHATGNLIARQAVKRSRRPLVLNRIHDDQHIASRHDAHQAHAQNPTVEHLDIVIEIILFGEPLHRPHAQPLVAQQNVAQPQDRYPRLIRVAHFFPFQSDTLPRLHT